MSSKLCCVLFRAAHGLEFYLFVVRQTDMTTIRVFSKILWIHHINALRMGPQFFSKIRASSLITLLSVVFKGKLYAAFLVRLIRTQNASLNFLLLRLKPTLEYISIIIARSLLPTTTSYWSVSLGFAFVFNCIK